MKEKKNIGSRKITTLVSIIGLSFALQSGVLAQQPGGTKEKELKCDYNPVVSAGYNSNYLVNGDVIDENSRMQGYVGAGLEGAGWGFLEGSFFDVWTDYDMKQKRFEEIDPELTIPFNVSIFDGSFYAGMFNFPNSDLESTGEIGINFGTKKVLFDPKLYVGQTIGNQRNGLENGQIITGSLEKNFELNSDTSLNFKGELNYTSTYGDEETGFENMLFSGKLEKELAKGLSSYISYEYSIPIEERLEEESNFSIGLDYCY